MLFALIHGRAGRGSEQCGCGVAAMQPSCGGSCILTEADTCTGPTLVSGAAEYREPRCIDSGSC
jgi:hypothetical protein